MSKRAAIWLICTLFSAIGSVMGWLAKSAGTDTGSFGVIVVIFSIIIGLVGTLIFSTLDEK